MAANGKEGVFLLAHHDALTEMRYDIDSAEYWNYLAERVGKPLAEVHEYWQRNPNYTNYVAPYPPPAILGLAAPGGAVAAAAANMDTDTDTDADVAAAAVNIDIDTDTDTDADVVADDAGAAAPAAADANAGAAPAAPDVNAGAAPAAASANVDP